MHTVRLLVPMLFLLLSVLAVAQRAPESSDRFSVAETANALITFHTGQLELAQAVLDKLQGQQQVREFAEQMLRRHAELNHQTLVFVDRYAVEASQTAVSTELKNRMVAHERSLQNVSSALAANAFLRQQTALYRDMLSLMDDRLLPNAESAELRDLLQKTRVELAQQLSRAGWLQARLLHPDSDEPAVSSQRG